MAGSEGRGWAALAQGAAALAVALAACGDDASGGADAGRDAQALDAGRDGGTGDATTDAAPSAPDAGMASCTTLPEIVDTGRTAPRTAEIDPGTFDSASMVTLDVDASPQDDALFPIGILAGGMTPDGAIVLTRVADEEPVTLRVWRPAGASGEVWLVKDETHAPADGGFAKIEVRGLAPATTYRYAFYRRDGERDVARTAIGNFRTAFADDMALTMTLGATTCTGSARESVREEVVPFPALSLMATEELDTLLHLGDMSYNDNATSLDEYRAEWSRTLNVRGYRDLLPSTGVYVTWDDHEVTDNWDPEAIASARLEAATQAFFETVPMPRGPMDRLWRSFSWGRTAEIFVLDARSERLPSTLDEDMPVFASEQQLEFIKRGLSESQAHFKLVMTSVNIANLPGPWDADFAMKDRWEGYETQRRELLDFIVDEEIRNVWFLAGDIHLGFVGRVEPEGHRHSKIWEITVGPGASGANPLGALLERGLIDREQVFPCQQFVYGNGLRQVATTLTLDPLADTIGVRYVDALTEEVLFDERLQQEPLSP
jgi:alkaline phosphatase D